MVRRLVDIPEIGREWVEVSGGAAFPVPDGSQFSCGMTLRDWFAGQALAGFTASTRLTSPRMAEDAYMLADAMLKERAMPQEVGNDRLQGLLREAAKYVEMVADEDCGDAAGATRLLADIKSTLAQEAGE